VPDPNYGEQKSTRFDWSSSAHSKRTGRIFIIAEHAGFAVQSSLPIIHSIYPKPYAYKLFAGITNNEVNRDEVTFTTMAEDEDRI
jgi:hypothetical protein